MSNNSTFSYNNVFCSQVEALADKLTTSPQKKWWLYCQDTFLFAIGFFALLKSGKTIILPQNLQQNTIDESGGFIISDASINFSPSTKSTCEFALDDFADSEIIFSTSGSSGTPKQVIKKFRNLLCEVGELEKLWGKSISADATFISTVSHQHIYGLLFRLLWPLSRGSAIHSSLTFTPEDLINRTKTKAVLISSPAFLKRLAENENLYSFGKNIELIFSSGGALDSLSAQKTNDILGRLPFEILGSTETGGIGYRQNSNLWTTFQQVKVKTKERELLVSSPYINDAGYISTGDTAEVVDQQHFILKERIGRIVKIEEKRVSLTEIEQRLNSCELVASSYSLILQEHRQIIGAVVVLTAEGKQKLAELGKLDFNKLLREYLSQYFEAVVIPRKWRYVDEIKMNEQGKVAYEGMKELFD